MPDTFNTLSHYFSQPGDFTEEDYETYERVNLFKIIHLEIQRYVQFQNT